MRQISLCIAALLPFAAMAEQQEALEEDALRNAIPATMLLDENVLSENDREIGEVEEILIARDGTIELFLLDIEDSDLGNDDEDGLPDAPRDQRVRTDPDMTAKGDGLERGGMDRGDVEWGEDLVAVDPRDMHYDATAHELIVRSGASPKAVAESTRDELLELEEIIGMEVSLADEESFGSVEEVMLDADQSRVVALVVDNWDGFDKQRRALPVDTAVIRFEEEEIVYPYTLDEIRQIGEFDLDKYDDGWF